PAGPAQSLFRGLPRRGERRAVGEAGLETPHLRRHPVADFAHPLLRLAQALVPEHARQERRPLRLAECRHHGQLLLAREVGVEELVVAHSQRALQLVGDRLERIRDHLAVLVEHRGGEPALHAVLVGAESELEVHLDARPTLRAEPADRVLVSTHRLHAVQRPGDRLEDRRLAGAVRPDDPRDPGTELELGIGVLAEVHEAEPQQLHQVPPPSSPSRPTCATYSTPSRTNSARSKSASSGRCSRNSWTVSGSVCRCPGAPEASARRTSGRRRSSWKWSPGGRRGGTLYLDDPGLPRLGVGPRDWASRTRYFPGTTRSPRPAARHGSGRGPHSPTGLERGRADRPALRRTPRYPACLPGRPTARATEEC